MRRYLYVVLTNHDSTISSGIVTTADEDLLDVDGDPVIPNADRKLYVPKMLSMLLLPGPASSRPTFCSTKLMPMAEIAVPASARCAAACRRSARSTVERRRPEHRHAEDEQDDPDLEQDRRVRRHGEDRTDQQEGQHRTEHEDVAVGEVDELDDAVDEGVAERHEGEDQAVREADDLGLEELLRAEDDDPEDLEQREREDRLAWPGSFSRSGRGLRLVEGTGPGCRTGRAEDGPPRSGTLGMRSRYSLTDRISWKAGGQLVSTLKPLMAPPMASPLASKLVVPSTVGRSLVAMTFLRTS